MKRYLPCMVWLLAIVNVFLLPNTISAFSSGVTQSTVGDCGCHGSWGAISGSDVAEGALLAQAGGDPPLLPACPGGCLHQVIYYYACLEVQYQCDPENQSLDDRKFRHGYTEYFCPGQTWYGCHGFAWEFAGCCKDASSSTLPVGCNPPHAPDAQECNT